MPAAAKKRPAAKKAPAKKAAPRRPAAKSPRRVLEEAAAATTSPASRRALLEAPGEPEEPSARPASDYFAQTEKEGVEFLTSGCTIIDCVVGGGWAMGRVVNIVGDKSAGKTLLAIEACANFDRQYPDGYMRYGEAEAAFDQKYAEALGLPEGRVDFNGSNPDKGLDTVEDFFEDMNRCLDKHGDKPMLYILDSLDALSDAAEAGREIDEGSFGANKAKKMGELFRRLVRRIEESRCLLIIISQLRDKINVTFGEKQTRSGGRALDFYASQVVWLADVGKLTKEIGGVKRVVGNDVKLRCKKNKVGLPFRECEYPVIYGYGVDDMAANVQWLLEVKRGERLKEVGMSEAGYKVRIGNLRNKGGPEAASVREKLNRIVRDEWTKIETKFLPQSRKYG